MGRSVGRNRSLLCAVFTQAQIMLFVQFRCLTFTCEVCNSFGLPVGRRRSDRRSPVRSSPEVVIIRLSPSLPESARVPAAQRRAAFLRDFFPRLGATESGAERSRCTVRKTGARAGLSGDKVAHTGPNDWQINWLTSRLISMRPESPAAA
ncbi:hypothetical protein OJAV_G00159270 [Oryzias javanicus]|uniref:Uncharacterized protein n=1 Tax=Oryzias javanicus TaxID=123683 RepID=A0A3S2U4K6_ORYJA|nr:hypothetical protein OJAV_G00159270 [Oryzias javanicus]